MRENLSPFTFKNGVILMSKTLSASLEDYLEAIYNLILDKKVARVRDIAENLSVTMPAVTGALKQLDSLNLVNYTPYEYIELTKKGTHIASQIVRRHKVIKKFLEEILKIPSDQASENACRMEHVIDDIVLERLIKFIEFVESCPRTGEDWLSKFDDYCNNALDEANKKKCFEKYVQELENKEIFTTKD